MSNYEHKDGSGALFKNDRKEKETHPDYRGELMIEGTLYEVAAWLKEGKKGKFMSLSAKPKSTETAPPTKRGQPAGMDDDSIPF